VTRPMQAEDDREQEGVLSRVLSFGTSFGVVAEEENIWHEGAAFAFPNDHNNYHVVYRSNPTVIIQ
jgi:hypothetical protein